LEENKEELSGEVECNAGRGGVSFLAEGGGRSAGEIMEKIDSKRNDTDIKFARKKASETVERLMAGGRY